MWVGIGHLGRDAELVQLPSGTAELRFTLAIDDPYQDRNGNWVERVYWIPVQVNIPTFVNAYANRLTKGITVLVQGKLVTYTFTDSQGQTRSGFVIDANYIRIIKRPDQQWIQAPVQQNVAQSSIGSSQANVVPPNIPTPQTNPPIPPQTQTNVNTAPQPTPQTQPNSLPTPPDVTNSSSDITPPDTDEFDDLPF